MATINEDGKTYNFTAVADSGFGYGMLGDKPVLKIDEIGIHIKNVLENSHVSAKEREEVILMESCLFKLQAVLYHLRNIKIFKENFLNGVKKELINKEASGLTMCYLPVELVSEFEALLLQARACLDAITVLVTKNLQGQQINYFTKLENVLEKFRKSESINKINDLLKESNWLLECGALTGASPTRGYVAHQGSLLTIQKCCLTVSGIERRRLLLFDLEFSKDLKFKESMPVINTASKILEYIPYFVIGVLSILCKLTPVVKEEFANDLGNEFIILSKETVEPEKGFKVGVIKEMNRVNFIIEDRFISKDALAKAIQLEIH